MAVQKQDGLHTDAAKAGTDLRGKEMHAVTRQDDGTVELTGAGGFVDGIVSRGTDAGYHTSFNTRGNEILRWVAGAAIPINTNVSSDAQGRCVAGDTNVFGHTRAAVSAEGVVAEIVPGPAIA